MNGKARLLLILVAVFIGVFLFQVLRPAEAVDLRSAELDFFSQSGEDGVIRKLFEIIKPTGHWVVDFGCAAMA